MLAGALPCGLLLSSAERAALREVPVCAALLLARHIGICCGGGKTSPQVRLSLLRMPSRKGVPGFLDRTDSVMNLMERTYLSPSVETKAVGGGFARLIDVLRILWAAWIGSSSSARICRSLTAYCRT